MAEKVTSLFGGHILSSARFGIVGFTRLVVPWIALPIRDTAMIRPLDRLLAIMARLRDPQNGCPWDREQSFATIAPYTLEEAYEVADAIARGDSVALKDELGDLLFQVVFHARMAEEAGLFSFDDV